jgi:hypothetical protein
MATTLSQALVTFSVTLMALIFAGYFGLRRRLVLVAVCLVCFFALLTQSVVYGGELC